MTARHEHTFHTDSYILATNCAGWSFKFTRLLILLTVLLLYLYNGKLANRIFFGTILMGSSFGLLLTHSSSHFKEVNIRCEIAIEIAHEHIRREPCEHSIHS
jgi:hypothetical protein